MMLTPRARRLLGLRVGAPDLVAQRSEQLSRLVVGVWAIAGSLSLAFLAYRFLPGFGLVAAMGLGALSFTMLGLLGFAPAALIVFIHRRICKEKRID